MNYKENIRKVRENIKKIRYLESMEEYLHIDIWYTSPKGGFEYESKVSEYISELQHDKTTSNEVKGLVEAFKDMDEKDYRNDIDRGMVRYLTNLYNEANLIPVELQMELNKSCKNSQRAWEKAYNNDDFDSVKPYLKEQLDIQKRIANAINPNESPYQVLVRRNDDYDLEEIDNMFNRIKDEIVDILNKTEEKRKSIDSSFLDMGVDKEILKKLVLELQGLIGVDRDKIAMFETRHPFCNLNGPKDSRIALNYGELIPSLLSAGHESGHAMYNYNSSEEVIDAGIWGGPEGAMHESQSKFYENLVCRTPEFWESFYPILQKYLPEFKNISLNKMMKAINKPEVKLRRLSSDELTTPLHIIIRYELERDFFEGKIGLDQLNDAWNAKYKEYLGIEPNTYREGILQDVHWFSGYIGYFQGYLLGEIYAAQFQHKMILDKPNAYKNLAKGDISKINNWIKENIHSYGHTYTVDKTIEKATGEKLNVEYYISNLKDKFLS